MPSPGPPRGGWLGDWLLHVHVGLDHSATPILGLPTLQPPRHRNEQRSCPCSPCLAKGAVTSAASSSSQGELSGPRRDLVTATVSRDCWPGPTRCQLAALSLPWVGGMSAQSFLAVQCSLRSAPQLSAPRRKQCAACHATGPSLCQRRALALSVRGQLFPAKW